MERYRFLLLFILILQPLLGSSQSYWKIGNEYGDEILLTIELNKAKNTFEAFSRRDALKDLAGIFTYSLAKAAGKLRYPEIVFIEGKTRQKDDSLLMNGNFNYFDKQFQFSGSLAGIHFDGEYVDRGRVHRLTGVKVPDCKPIKDYSSMISSAFLLADKNVFNPAWLNSDEWLEFKKKVNDLKLKISDDYELAATCFWLGKKLPFSPFEISKSRPNNKSAGRKNRAGFREVKANTAFLEGNSLPQNQNEMDSIAIVLDKSGYRNLIIDLRGNSRISPVAANIILNYLSDRPFSAGVYLTRKWNEGNAVTPLAQDYPKLFKSLIDKEFRSGELYKERGRYLNIIPGEKRFRGKVFLIINSKTNRVAEMITAVVKARKIGTIIGQRSAGLTFVSENIPLNSEYDLILPDCDFFSPEGRNLNNTGVDPDIAKSDEVMKYVLELI